MAHDTSFDLATIQNLVKQQLAPLACDIDQQGVYPDEFMHALGKLGGYAVALPQQVSGRAARFADQLDVIGAVGEACGSTAFSVWCQTICAWYLYKTPNSASKARYLADVAQGNTLCGTGMSNTVKHLAGIEKMHLKAKQEGDHYIIDGILPWVSNIGKKHAIIVAAQLDEQRYVMFIVDCNTPNLELHDCPEFSGMEGTQTYNVRFHSVRIDADQVLAHPQQFFDYIKRIKTGFVLSQAAMGFGIIQASLAVIAHSNKTHQHVNQYLDAQHDDIQTRFEALKHTAYHLADLVDTDHAPILDILKLREQASMLTLEAANSAALHIGARGYLMRHPAQRRLREAMFVAIVTPALKHLRKEIAALEYQAHAKAS